MKRTKRRTFLEENNFALSTFAHGSYILANTGPSHHSLRACLDAVGRL